MGLILKSLMPAYGGYTIAREDKVIFIRGAIPGEVVEVDIQEKKRDYSIGLVTNVLEPSEFRDEPRCSVFGICGGCQLQYISYEKQLSLKDEILLDSIARLADLEIRLDPPLSDLQWQYRHRAQFKIRQGTIGFFRESSREVVSFDHCPLMHEKINMLLKEIKKKPLPDALNEMHIASGDHPVVLLKAKDCDNDLIKEYADIGFAGTACNDGLITGKEYTGFDLNGIAYTVSPWTFFQAHWSLNTKVVQAVAEMLQPLQGTKILDLYAGAGNLSLPLAVHADEVVAVEENRRAVDDGNRNLKLNSLKNCRFIHASAEKYRIRDRFDVILLDPPRPGLTAEVMNKVLDSGPETIAYLSCNPATLARDLKKLKTTYEVRSVQQVDFFPNTFHIEALVLLQRK